MDLKVLHTLEYDKIKHILEQHAASVVGKENVQSLDPSSDLEEVQRRLQDTDEAVKAIRFKGSAPFAGVRDIRAAAHRARIGGMLSPQELLDIAGTLSGGRKLRRFLEPIHAEHGLPRLCALYEEIAELRKLDDEIRSCINDHGEVSDGASSQLRTIRQSLRGGEARIRERLEQMLRSSSVQKMLQDQLITIRNDRFVIPVKHEYRTQLGGIVHDQSASGATLFIEPEAIVQMNNRLRELRLEEEREIEKILTLLTDKVAEVHDDLLHNVWILGQLDFIFAKAEYAGKLRGELPRMNDRGFFRLKQARHPLIERKHAVPIDVELGNEVNSIIVTGPNTGGKTVSLKTIGLLHLMAMSGLFVPVHDGSSMCVFDAIYADIGDEQSIEQSLSTFSSHMTNIIRMIEKMTPKSLVLLDELGAGTDPAEGSALAIAILEHIHAQGCRMVATTHYSELKAYAFERRGVINASMEFDVQTLSPTYRLLLGVPGRSNAFAIAERLGLRQDIIQQARGQVADEDLKVENMIASLEQNRQSAESDKERALELRKQLEQEKQKQEASRERFEQQRDKMIQKAEEQAQAIVDKARQETEALMSELRKMAMDEKASFKEHKWIEARKRLDEAAPERQVTTAKAVKTKVSGEVEPGDQVLVPAFGQRGTVLEAINAQEWLVQLGGMRMKVNKRKVELFQKAAPSASEPKPIARVKRTRDDSVRNELDLRGSSMEDALLATDQFLDEAIMANLGQVSIIHGKGTGVLRAGIQDLLRNHRHVKQYRFGAYNEGGNGVTIAELD